MITSLYLLLCSLVAISAHPLEGRADSVTAAVNFNNNTGTPKHLASGILYGVPDQQNQIPSSFYTGMGFNYLRAGGAQVGAPGRGWIWGMNEYKVSSWYMLLSEDETDDRTGSHLFYQITKRLDNIMPHSSFSLTIYGVPILLKIVQHLTLVIMAIGHITINTSLNYLPI
jgi:hypothetical protein